LSAEATFTNYLILIVYSIGAVQVGLLASHTALSRSQVGPSPSPKKTKIESDSGHQ